MLMLRSEHFVGSLCLCSQQRIAFALTAFEQIQCLGSNLNALSEVIDEIDWVEQFSVKRRL